MVTGRMLLVGAACWALVVLGSCEDLKEARSLEDAAKTQQEKELVRVSALTER